MQQAPVVQTLDSAIHRTNHYPADKHYGNQLRYPLDSYLSGGYRYPPFEQLGPGPLAGVMNGPLKFLSARKFLPLLDLLAKLKRVLACSCSRNFCSFSCQ